MSSQKSTLCIFFKSYEGPILYTMYAFNNVTGIGKLKRRAPKPLTVLEMRRDEYPIGMGFVKLDSTLYFVGGQFAHEKKPFASRKVFTLDLDAIKQRKRHHWTIIDPPVLVEGPRMNIGKVSPLVIATHGMLYVLASDFREDPSGYLASTSPNDPRAWDAETLGSLPPNYGADDMTEIVVTPQGKMPSTQGIFEVYNPGSGKWQVLPSPPIYHCFGRISSLIDGHAVVRDKIVLCQACELIHVFDINTRSWVVMDCFSISGDVQTDCDYAWFKVFLRGLVGRTQVVGDTLFTVNGCSQLLAYDIPSSNADTSYDHCAVDGIRIPYFQMHESTGGLTSVDSDIIHIGGGKFLMFSCGNAPDAPVDSLRPVIRDDCVVYKPDFRMVIFEVSKEDYPAPYDMVRWSAEIKDTYVIEDFDAGWIDNGCCLYYFALDGTIDERCCDRSKYGPSFLVGRRKRSRVAVASPRDEVLSEKLI